MKLSLKVSVIAMLTSLSILFRIAKNLFTVVQFVNFPLLFAMLGGALYGFHIGFLVGLFSFVVSDLVVGLGAWTFIDGLLAGVIGGSWAMIIKAMDRGGFFLTVAYLSVLLYDVSSSAGLYMLFGLRPLDALVLGFLGLFSPAYGGYLFGVGVVTELTTSLLFLLTFRALEKRGVGLWMRK
ncbi:MAG: hypothetical protein J7L38_04495 [Thermoproteales archaeon]|nr:hypothetical protein [Thermoproteales archaeon]